MIMTEIKQPVKDQKTFTKMTNVSNKTLYLACGTVKPGETVEFNQAEWSSLVGKLEAK